jgi:hypothetical protein
MTGRSFLEDVERELDRAQAKYPPMNSAHEAYAVILEEVEELWELIKIKQAQHDHAAMYDEAVQAAAMLARFAEDILKPGTQATIGSESEPARSDR